MSCVCLGVCRRGGARPGVVPLRPVVVKYPQLYRKGAVSSGGRSAEEALYEGRYGRQVFDASNLDFRGSGFAASGVVVPESGAHVPLRPSAGGRSATEVPPVAVSRVDVPQVAPVEGPGASRGASQVPVKPVEAPQVGEVPPASGAGSGAAGMQAVKPGGVADDAVVARGSAGGVREPEAQLRPVEEPKVEGLDTAQVQRVARDEHLVPAAHGKAVPELAERGIPNGGGTYSKGFNNAPRADDYLEGQRPGWSTLEQRRIKEYNDPNLEYYDEADKTKREIQKYKRNMKAYNKALERNREIVLRAERDGVEVGSVGYELHPVPEAPKKPALRIFRDELYKNEDGTRAKLDFATGMEGSNSGNKSYLITRPSEYGEKIPDEVFETGENILTNRNLDINSDDLRFKDYKNFAQPMVKNEAGDYEKHIYRALPTHAENGAEVDYFEATVNVPGSSGKEGSHRIVIASNGSIFYTPTHYDKFILIKE